MVLSQLVLSSMKLRGENGGGGGGVWLSESANEPTGGKFSL